jgi:hypothetical protein
MSGISLKVLDMSSLLQLRWRDFANYSPIICRIEETSLFVARHALKARPMTSFFAIRITGPVFRAA